MRVILAQHLADDACRLFERGTGTDAHIVHGIQDPAVDRLQSVTRIRQGARHDHRHGVIQVRAAHLLVDVRHVDGADDLPDWFRAAVVAFWFYHNYLIP